MKWFFLIFFVIIQTNGYVQDCGNSEIAERKYDGVLKNLELTNDRVLRGNESELNQWPWIVHLYIDFFFGGTFNCTGSVIHPHWILTAAHCLEWDLSVTTVDVYYGSNEKPKLEKLTVKKIYRYPKYDEKKAYYGDIALLELAPDSYIPETITPICLFKDDQLEDEEPMVVAGWGYDLINISSS
uniref:Peptidase S1 domain-containing protein n=1 Tax=Panagrolaimus sp. JU765 TaxID=591449 RepID=A0AC34QI14_9BILA